MVDGAAVKYILTYLSTVVPYMRMRKLGPVQFEMRAFGQGPSSLSDFLMTSLPLSGRVISSQQSPVRHRVSETHALASLLQEPSIGVISPFLITDFLASHNHPFLPVFILAISSILAALESS